MIHDVLVGHALAHWGALVEQIDRLGCAVLVDDGDRCEEAVAFFGLLSEARFPFLFSVDEGGCGDDFFDGGFG